MLTQRLARLPQSIDRLLNIRKRETLGSKRNYSPNTAGSGAEELPSHDVPCTMSPRLLVYIRFCDGRRNELKSPSPLGLKGPRWIPCTGCREVGVGERQFPLDEDQLAYQSAKKTTNSCSRGTAHRRQNYASLSDNEGADVAVDASLNCLNPLTRIFGNVLQNLRHHLWHEHLLEHLPAYDGANFGGNNGFLLDVDAYAK